MFNIIIDGINYDYVGTVKINDTSYILYTDNENLDISEYTYKNGKLKLSNIDDKTYNLVLREYKNEIL